MVKYNKNLISIIITIKNFRSSYRPQSQLKNKEKPIENKQIVKVGKLTFSRDDFLGKGGYGTVFRGKLEGTTIDVAIKRIDKTELKKDFFEIEIYPKIQQHPNIVRFHHVEKDEDFV